MSLTTSSATYGEARDWYRDRYQAVYVSRNRWLLATLVALGLAVAQAAALVVLVPLKTSVPFLIKEETTGVVTTLQPLQGSPAVTFDESVHKYFLGRYVSFRETYDPSDLAENYRAVETMSSPSAAGLFKASIVTSNPASPIVRYGTKTQRSVRIKSIVFLNPQTAQVRFITQETSGSSTSQASHWIATVTYGFGPASVLESNRFINPLGFTVTHYRIDQEVVP
jgi:type IV secretion system protein VirB8